MKKNFNLKKIRIHKSLKIIFVILIPSLMFLFVLFPPYLTAASFAESKIGNSEILKTDEFLPKKITKFINPEFIIYSETNGQGQATYVKLRRHYLVLWEIADFKQLEGNIEELEESIEGDKITPDDFGGGIDLEAIEKNSTRPNYEPGSSTTEIETMSGDKIQVILGSNQQDNEMTFNGQGTGIKNIYSVSLSPDEKFLYYTKFSSQTLDDGFIITTSDGKVYRYNLGSKSEDEIYSFGEETSLSFRVNSKYIFYTTGKSEVGKVSLEGKQKTTFDTSKLGMDLNVETAGDIGEYTPLNVINLDEEIGILEVTLPEKEPKYFKINLSNLSISE